jgi:UDP-N-acetyl-D-mannosaminuronic acid dehydrogenase
VCIIGLGYVGLTLAVAMADVGFRVHGVERSQEILSCLKQSRATFVETGLDERLAARIADGSFTFSETIPTGHISAVFIITVGTPLEKGQKSTDLASIRTVSDMVADALRPGDLVILRSTVRVGVSRDVVKPILDKAGVAFDLAFCPERTLEGSALRELRTLPQIVAGLDETSCLRATQLFNFLTPTTVMVHDLETAEMVKLINNTQRELLFAFANEVAHFCDVVWPCGAVRRRSPLPAAARTKTCPELSPRDWLENFSPRAPSGRARSRWSAWRLRDARKRPICADRLHFRS